MKNKYVICSVILSIIITIALALAMPEESRYKQIAIKATIETRVEHDAVLKFYYLEDMNQEYSEDCCVSTELSASSEFQKVEFELPTNVISNIRIDIETEAEYWDIRALQLSDAAGDKNLTLSELDAFNKNDVIAVDISNGEYMAIKVGDVDPYLTADTGLETGFDKSIDYRNIVIPPVFLFLLIVLLKNKDIILDMLRGIYGARRQIMSLAVSDFKGRFSGSYLGVIWGAIQPLMTILLFWFVFQVGFRSQPISNAPFILWLVAGMIPWNFFSDAWSSGSGSFTGYSYIVKKLVFNIDILPLVKILSSSVLNMIFHLLIIIIYTLYGRFPGIHLIDMVYFAFCLTMLSLGLSMITATLNVFVKDIAQLLGVIMQFLMWATPIMWDYHMLSGKWEWIYKINPLFYVVNGYREALIDGKWFFSNFYMMLWFWFITITVNVVGIRLMRKLKPHFADVL